MRRGADGTHLAGEDLLAIEAQTSNAKLHGHFMYRPPT